jgi:hypothetical protein
MFQVPTTGVNPRQRTGLTDTLAFCSLIFGCYIKGLMYSFLLFPRTEQSNLKEANEEIS